VDYDSLFMAYADDLKREGRYRIFADLERLAGGFPKARYHSPSGGRATETVGQLGLWQWMGRTGHCWQAWPGTRGVNRSWSVPSRIRVRRCRSLSCPTVSVAPVGGGV
jgi:hypothetical protein